MSKTKKYPLLSDQDREDLENAVKKYSDSVGATSRQLIKSDFGYTGCGLCRRYRNVYGSGPVVCAGCPIRCHMQRHGCEGTPYDAVLKSKRDRLEYMRIYSEGPSACAELDSHDLRDLWKVAFAWLAYDLDAPDTYLQRLFRKRCAQEARFLQRLLDNDPGTE